MPIGPGVALSHRAGRLPEEISFQGGKVGRTGASGREIDHKGDVLELSKLSSWSGYRGQARRAVSVALSILLLLTLLPGAGAQQQRIGSKRRGGAAEGGVRLVVGIVIDQFRYDYLTRFEDQFVEGGFRRFLTRGANFTDNNYLHTPTYTAPGHATFMSGTTPALNGIIGNEWYDRQVGTTR
jgi:hypothetical protein